jgi:alkylated DNA repair dioxygenase AlkB
MQQLSFEFAPQDPSTTIEFTPILEPVPLVDGEMLFCRNLFRPEVGDRLFAALMDTVSWQQDHITLYGKSMPLPRLTAWYGDPGNAYTYSGIQMQPTPWNQPLLEIKSQVEAVAGTRFNSVLLNQYRHGQDSVAWHSDDEPELGENPVIASVSLGASRRFVLKHRYRKNVEKIELYLTHGSLLLMRGSTQHYWLHQIPKTAKVSETRMNLTFRLIQ